MFLNLQLEEKVTLQGVTKAHVTASNAKFRDINVSIPLGDGWKETASFVGTMFNLHGTAEINNIAVMFELHGKKPFDRVFSDLSMALTRSWNISIGFDVYKASPYHMPLPFDLFKQVRKNNFDFIAKNEFTDAGIKWYMLNELSSRLPNQVMEIKKVFTCPCIQFDESEFKIEHTDPYNKTTRRLFIPKYDLELPEMMFAAWNTSTGGKVARVCILDTPFEPVGLGSSGSDSSKVPPNMLIQLVVLLVIYAVMLI